MGWGEAGRSCPPTSSELWAAPARPAVPPPTPLPAGRSVSTSGSKAQGRCKRSQASLIWSQDPTASSRQRGGTNRTRPGLEDDAAMGVLGTDKASERQQAGGAEAHPAQLEPGMGARAWARRSARKGLSDWRGPFSGGPCSAPVCSVDGSNLRLEPSHRKLLRRGFHPGRRAACAPTALCNCQMRRSRNAGTPLLGRFGFVKKPGRRSQ